MTNPKAVCLLLFLGIQGQLLLAQNFNREVEAFIDVDSRGVRTSIVFSAYNKTPLKKSLRYRALIVKSDREGTSQQYEDEQYFIAEAGERKIISQANIEISEGERTIVFVLIYEEDQVIGKDRIVINGFEGEDDLQPSIVEEQRLVPQQEAPPSADVELLTGLVFENTKTKPGRDFYQKFYLAYTTNNINGNKMVKVDEVLAIGGNTQIRIYAGDDLVVQFFVNPRSSYMDQMVEYSIRRVNQYFQQNKAIRQNTISY